MSRKIRVPVTVEWVLPKGKGSDLVRRTDGDTTVRARGYETNEKKERRGERFTLEEFHAGPG